MIRPVYRNSLVKMPGAGARWRVRKGKGRTAHERENQGEKEAGEDPSLRPDYVAGNRRFIHRVLPRGSCSVAT